MPTLVEDLAESTSVFDGHFADALSAEEVRLSQFPGRESPPATASTTTSTTSTTPPPNLEGQPTETAMNELRPSVLEIARLATSSTIAQVEQKERLLSLAVPALRKE